MAIDYSPSDQSMTIECDNCGELAVFYGNFHECIAQAKADDWIIFKDSDVDEFVHFDKPECRAVTDFVE